MAHLELKDGQFLTFDRGHVHKLGQDLGEWEEIEKTEKGYIARKIRRDGENYYNVFKTLGQACFALGIGKEELRIAEVNDRHSA